MHHIARAVCTRRLLNVQPSTSFPARRTRSFLSEAWPWAVFEDLRMPASQVQHSACLSKSVRARSSSLPHHDTDMLLKR